MNILAIDTTNEYLSLALNKLDAIHELQLKVGNKQSEQVIPQIHELLKTTNLTLADINGIAYNMGPGSFTGLRICLSVAKGLAYSLNRELYPIPAFLLYAQQVQMLHNSPYCLVTLDARLEQIYVAVVNCKDFSFAIQPTLINPQDLTQYLAKADFNAANLCVAGNGWMTYQEKIPQEFTTQLNYIETNYPSPKTMLQIIGKNIIKPLSVYEADLLYLRNKVALNLDEQKQNKNL